VIEQACDMIGEGLKPEQFTFVWMCDTWQFHGFKSLAYLFASNQDKFMRISDKKWEANIGRKFEINGVERELKPIAELPTWKLIRYWYKRIQKQDMDGKLYQDMKYGAEKRIRRRYHAQTGIDQTPYLGDSEKEYGVLSTPVDLITLDRMLYKTPESRAVLRKQRVEKAAALVESLFNDENSDWLGLDELEAI
jgi:hypothetical protein